MTGDDRYYNVTRQVVLQPLQVCPPATIIVHYQIKVDVLDAFYNLVATRSRDRQFQISFTGLKPTSNSDEVAESLINQSELLPPSRRAELLQAVEDLKNGKGRTAKKSEDKRMVHREMAVSMSKAEVDTMLHQALQDIHWAKQGEDKTALAGLVQMSLYDRNLALILGYEALMNLLRDKVRKYASSNLPACISVMQIFERMSYFRDFHESLTRFQIGSTTVNLIHGLIQLSGVAQKSLAPSDLPAYDATVNRLLGLSVSLLMNLAETAATMRKMVEKHALCMALTRLVGRKNEELAAISCNFLRRIGLVPANWTGGFVDPELIASVVCAMLREYTGAGLVAAVELLVVLSTREQAFAFFPEAELPALEGVLDNPGLAPSLTLLIHNLQATSGGHPVFAGAKFVEFLVRQAVSDVPHQTTAVCCLARLGGDRGAAQLIAASPLFTTANLRRLFVRAAGDSGAAGKACLRMIRNVADSQPGLVSGFDEEIVVAAQQVRNRVEALGDVLGVANRVKMNPERAAWFAQQQGFTDLIVSAIAHPDAAAVKGGGRRRTTRGTPIQVLIEAVMFMSSLALYSGAAKALGSAVVAPLADLFVQAHPDQLDLIAQCLYTLHRFIIHTDSRTALLARTGIVDAIVEHCGSRNQGVATLANEVIDVLVMVDDSWRMRVQRPRFVAFNQEWIASFGRETDGA